MLNFVFCPSEDITADILTKAPSKWKVRFHNSTLGLRDSVALEGEWRDSVPREGSAAAQAAGATPQGSISPAKRCKNKAKS
jgi:hypothetical protein